jgi:hypothetical protein
LRAKTRCPDHTLKPQIYDYVPKLTPSLSRYVVVVDVVAPFEKLLTPRSIRHHGPIIDLHLGPALVHRLTAVVVNLASVDTLLPRSAFLPVEAAVAR